MEEEEEEEERDAAWYCSASTMNFRAIFLQTYLCICVFEGASPLIWGQTEKDGVG